jgi:hypothetical protein
MTTLAVTVAALSLVVSLVTVWLTLFRRGTVTMTRPTAIYFGPDGPRSPSSPSRPKVYLRTLLFATSKRGRAIESMHVVLSHDGTDRSFSIWVYGDHKQFVRGSGLFVGETGIPTTHQFLLQPGSGSFRFTDGLYKLDVFVRLLGDERSKRLFTEELTVSHDTAALMERSQAGVYFDWEPDADRYLSHVDKWQA